MASCDTLSGCFGGVNIDEYISQNYNSKWILDRLATLEAEAITAATTAAELATCESTLGDHNKLKTRYNELVC